MDRDLGRLEGRVEAVQLRLARIEKDMIEVLDTLQQAKGGWRMLILIGGGCAAIGSAVTAWFTSFRG